MRPLLLTMGDPAGIGPELVAMLFRDRPDWARQAVVVGDLACLQRALDVVGVGGLAVHELQTLSDWQPDPHRLPLWPSSRLTQVPAFGRVAAEAGQAAAAAIEMATHAVLAGQAAAVVTAPVHKESLAAAGVPYPGHTEMLQALAARHVGVPVGAMPVRMMLANPTLRTVLVSIHVSLREAIDRVTVDNVLTTLRITARHWERIGQPPPRIAVAGLNPHAGEGGLFGREEIDVIAPAVVAARHEGMQVSGPHAPDTVFMRARSGEFDVVVAMYHDQGLIPVKYMGVADGVNVTLGLPLVRTSPDHGTAFDLAGTGRADPSSFVAATELAAQMAWTRSG